MSKNKTAKLPPDALESQIIEKMVDQIRDLLNVHWPKIAELRDDDTESAISIGLATDVNCAGSSPVVKTKISYSQKFKDEIEERLDDQNQGRLFEKITNSKGVDSVEITSEGKGVRISKGKVERI
jgi:hypothetical protein